MGGLGESGEGVCQKGVKENHFWRTQNVGRNSGGPESPPIRNRQKLGAKSVAGKGGEAATLQPPRLSRPAQVGGSRLARGLLQLAGGVGSRFLGKSPPSAGMGLSGCPLLARGGGLGPRSSRDPGIAGRPDGNPAFDRDCREGLSPWQQEGGETEPSAWLQQDSTPAVPPLVPSPPPPFWVLSRGRPAGQSSKAMMLSVQGS